MCLTQKERYNIVSRVHCTSDFWKGEKELICCPSLCSLFHNSWSQGNSASSTSTLSYSLTGKSGQRSPHSEIYHKMLISMLEKTECWIFLWHIYFFGISQMPLQPFIGLFISRCNFQTYLGQSYSHQKWICDLRLCMTPRLLAFELEVGKLTALSW